MGDSETNNDFVDDSVVFDRNLIKTKLDEANERINAIHVVGAIEAGKENNDKSYLDWKSAKKELREALREENVSMCMKWLFVYEKSVKEMYGKYNDSK